MRISELNERQIKDLSQKISANGELFTDKENKIKEEINNYRSQKVSIEMEIKNLGIVDHPGFSPKVSKEVKPAFQWSFWPYLIGLILLFAFHCVIWVAKLLFDIPWDTWLWTKTFFILGGMFVVFLCVFKFAIYGIKHWVWNKHLCRYRIWKADKERLEKKLEQVLNNIGQNNQSLMQLERNREKVLLFAFKNYLAFPIKSLKGTWSYSAAKKVYLQYKSSLEHLRHQQRNGSTNMDDVLNYFNDKYKLFCTYSLPAEAPSNDVLREFLKYYPKEKNNNVYRGEICIKGISSLKKQARQFDEYSLDDEMDHFNEVLKMDTSGFFTEYSSSLLEEQIDLLQSIYDDTATILESHNNLISSINFMLGMCRLVSYRNIYLGSELINIIRENGGGGNASTANDFIHLNNINSLNKLDVVHFSASDSMQDIIASGLDGMATFIENGVSDKDLRKYALNNPKEAAMYTLAAGVFSAINAGIDAWKQRNAKIESLLRKEEELIDGMKRMVESYLAQVSYAKRGIEIIETLTKVNNGLIEIYRPLYDKVFIQRDVNSITMQEIQQLARALSEYNKLSKAEL